MTKFPSMIEYIDDLGLDELHNAHRDEMAEEDPSEQISFSDYVESHYQMAREMWDDEMINIPMKTNVSFDTEKEIALACAIEVMKTMIDEGLRENRVRDIILTDDLAPDYTSAVCIVDEFRKVVLPAIEKALNELGA